MSENETVGRNEPCPCGSGKKSKQCCSAAEDAPAPRHGVPMGAWVALGLIVVAFVAWRMLGQEREPTPATTTAPETTALGTVAAPIVGMADGSVPATGSAQPPGPAPPGKVWSPDHGHWHDDPSAAAAGGITATPGMTPGVTATTLDGSTLTPAPMTPGPQPPGPVPPGKVWSPEHGHWHDDPAAAGSTASPITITPVEGGLPAAGAMPATPAPQPPGPVPPGKVWSAEHGHWHDDPVAAPPSTP